MAGRPVEGCASAGADSLRPGSNLADVGSLASNDGEKFGLGACLVAASRVRFAVFLEENR